MAISGIDSTMTSMDMWMRLHFTAYIQKSDRSVIRSFVCSLAPVHTLLLLLDDE